MANRRPPRSPHVQIYRPQLTSVLSFGHRITGLLLAAGAVVWVIWLSTAAFDQQAFATVNSAFASMPGRLLLFIWTFVLFFHLCNGIRHLFWDAVLGFALVNIYRSGWLVVLASVVLTGLAWGLAETGTG